MSTAISDIDTDIDTPIHPVRATLEPRGLDTADIDTADDLGFDTVPRVHRGTARSRTMDVAHRSVVDRRPRGARPAGALVAYDRGTRTSVRRPVRGAHPGELVEQAQVGFAVLAVAALLSALVVAALITLAHLRAGDWGGATTTGTVPAVVDGQSLTDDAVPTGSWTGGAVAPR
ncbi:hypothetical protein [Nocardia altamirensis]|uniref:hypothetical protein n=1 Tax=Nocardia altamirensis TaxID=472158 RepID=UPI0008403624|nr:hypothetical protein [Nocardia altamirensis]